MSEANTTGTTFDAATVLGVVGAGAMGAGIAQVAAARGHRVLLADAAASAVARARDLHAKAFAREVEKGRMTAAAADAARGRLTYVEGVGDDALRAFAACGAVVEAIVEDLAAKQALLRSLERVVAAETVLATNTSSLSIAALAGGCRRAERVIGMHFFNPAPVMPLVEVIPALATAPEVTARVQALATSWGKTAVVASDTPGFIVNRIARPFYGEALRLLEEGIADHTTIDAAMRALGFKMGPFELMDLIGNDVNYAVTTSVYDAMYHDGRYRPSLTQRRLVESGWLGRKSGRGYYDYADGATPPKPTEDEELARLIGDRVLAMLINEAVDAVRLRVASPTDIELAMTRGVNYPRGLLSWGDALGAGTVLATLEALQGEYGEERYRPSPLLRRTAKSGGRLLT